MSPNGDPLVEASRWLDAKLAGAPVPTLLLVIGRGEGHLLDVLEARAPETKVLALEPDRAATRAFRARRDWSRWLHSGRLIYLEAPHYRGSEEAWSIFPARSEADVLLTHPSIEARPGPAAVEAARVLKKILFGARANAAARVQFAPRYLLNSLRNLPAIVAGSDVRALDGAFRGVPAVVVGAGPSLDGSLGAFRDAADHALVISTDTALRPLATAGTPVPLVVGLDPGPANAKHFMLLPETPGTWLVSESALGSDRRRGVPRPHLLVSGCQSSSLAVVRRSRRGRRTPRRLGVGADRCVSGGSAGRLRSDCVGRRRPGLHGWAALLPWVHVRVRMGAGRGARARPRMDMGPATRTLGPGAAAGSSRRRDDDDADAGGREGLAGRAGLTQRPARDQRNRRGHSVRRCRPAGALASAGDLVGHHRASDHVRRAQAALEERAGRSGPRSPDEPAACCRRSWSCRRECGRSGFPASRWRRSPANRCSRWSSVACSRRRWPRSCWRRRPPPRTTSASAAARLGVETVRGSRDDVLARFLQPLTGTMAEVVVRATADCPAMDIDAARCALAAQDASGADYCHERELPRETVVEAIRTSALIAAAGRATALDDREHVTTFIRRRPAEYRVIEPGVPTALRRPDLCLTVDTEQDLAFLRAVADDLSVPLAAAPLADIIAAADRVCARPVR